MKRNKKSMLVLTLLLVVLIPSVFAIVYYTSSAIHKSITINGIDGAIINVVSFDDYDLRTVPIDFLDGYADVRQDSFLIGIEDTNIAGDVQITISASGVPVDMVVTTKMAYATYFKYETGTYTERKIVLFNEAETDLGFAYRDIQSEPDMWNTPDLSTATDLALDVPYVIPSVHVPSATLDASVPTLGAPIYTFDNCNGIWLQFTFDTSAMTNWGSYDIYVTVTLGE